MLYSSRLLNKPDNCRVYLVPTGKGFISACIPLEPCSRGSSAGILALRRRHLCSYPCYRQFLSILEWFLVVSPLPAFQEPKGKESPFSRTALTVSFSLFCEWSHVNHQPLPLEGSPTPQCQCIPLMHHLLGLRLGSLQPSYLPTRAEPACCSLYRAGILPSRNSVSRLQPSQIQDEFMVLENQNFSRLAL